METILKKIAFVYYEKLKDMGFEDDPKRNYRMAEKALNHLLKPKGDSEEYRQDEDDYKEFRKFL